MVSGELYVGAHSQMTETGADQICREMRTHPIRELRRLLVRLVNGFEEPVWSEVIFMPMWLWSRVKTDPAKESKGEVSLVGDGGGV